MYLVRQAGLKSVLPRKLFYTLLSVVVVDHLPVDAKATVVQVYCTP